jgi:hypothetical protein
MAWRFHGFTSSDPYKAKARGSCDRCSCQYDLDHLKFQYEYRGDTLMNTQFRVCQRCMDIPYQGRRPIRLPPDPIPVRLPRVEPLLAEENSTMPNNGRQLNNIPGTSTASGDG